MKLLETWMQTPLAGALGFAVLHSFWEGAILAALLAIVLVATRSARLRYAAACAAMLLLFFAFGVTLLRMLPETTATVRPPIVLSFPRWQAVNGAGPAGLSLPDVAAIVPWLALLWVAGVWIFYVRHLAGWLSVFRLRRRGVCCAPDRWQRELARLAAALRLWRPVQLLESSLADMPMVLGHLRPVILVPVGLLAQMPPQQIETILLHELAHVRRYDYLVNVFQRLVEGLLFYHPAVWWMSRTIRTERENCCDDLVVEISGNAREYAVVLAALEQTRCAGREPALAITGGNLMKRIRRLLYPTAPNSAWISLVAAVVLIATTAVVLEAWPAPPPQQGADDQPMVVFRTEASPYHKWLNEDVVYIISDKERAAFQKLTTNDEREKFIQQFWARRDPKPETLKNEFKDEHYRRIAYANERFRTASGRAGWQTDRGHMYILYGPPDEIESHPDKKSHPPYEDWLYHHLEGLGDNRFFKFIDRSGSGDYQIAPGGSL